jgi:hypothetical protein
MKQCFTKAIHVFGWIGRLAAVALSVALTGCSPEGTGSIKIENPQAIREKFEGKTDATKAKSAKQAKAVEVEEAAAKKHPKLR